ncbi:proline dehydrogenase family protein [Natrialbaceae archaeon A-gly3]
MIPPFVSRFVAGETPAEALEHARRLNDRGVTAMVNLLGAYHDDRAAVDADAAAYRQLIDDVSHTDLEVCLSVKPSQLGLELGVDVFRDHLETIVARGVPRDVFVWIDMEDHTTVDATLEAYEALARRHGGGVGVCVQADLERTPEDVTRLADVPGKLRLVKGGAYDAPPEITYTDPGRIDAAYRELLEVAFERHDDGVAVASHDPAMLEYAIELHEEHGTGFEIQMLMGVREGTQDALAAEYDVVQYVPYGRRWKYWIRWILAHRREQAWFAIRTALEGQLN